MKRKLQLQLACTVALVCTTTFGIVQPAAAQLNWTQVPQYVDVSKRMTDIDQSIVEALADGRLTQSQATNLKAQLEQVRAEDTKYREDGKLSMWERMRLVVNLDNLEKQIQASLGERKQPTTDITGRELDLDRRIQEAVISGRLTNLEGGAFKSRLQDIRSKEQVFRADGALTSMELLTLSQDLDKLTGDIDRGMREREISDPGLETRKAELKRRITDLTVSGKITQADSQNMIGEFNRILNREATFKASGNQLTSEEVLSLALDLERLKSNVDRYDPTTFPSAGVKGIDEQQADIKKQIDAARTSGTMTIAQATDLLQEFSRIESLEAMYRGDAFLTDGETLTLKGQLDALQKRVQETTAVTQQPGLMERKNALRKRISDGQAAERFNPPTIGTDLMNELSRIEDKERYYNSDGTMTDTETLIIARDLDALNNKFESSVSALPNLNAQKDHLERAMNDALASGRLDNAKADELRQEIQRIAYLESTFKGNDGYIDDREQVALNKEYNALQGKLDRSMPALPDVDVLASDVSKKLADREADKSLSTANAVSLQRELDRIKNVTQNFKNSDNRLTDWESMAVKRDLDRLNSDIDRLATEKPSAPTEVVVDIPTSAGDTRGHWAEKYIAVLQQRGTIGGFPDGSFKPDQGITRSQFAAIAVKALGLPAGGRDVEFRDLPKKHWAYKSICSASDAGLVGGFPDGSFRPEDNLTRAQALVILAKALQGVNTNNAALDKYSDASKVAAWAAPSVAKAATAGIIVNHPDPYAIRPDQLATRAEVAALTYQTMANLGQKLPTIRIGLEASSK